MNPPRDPANNEGYFEYIEGPVGTTPVSPGTPFAPKIPPPTASVLPSQVAVNTDNGNAADTTVGDFDDILMFTTRSTGRPFVGLCNNATIQSEVAEVAWFVRGRNLHRRVLLVAPNQGPWGSPMGFYQQNDISARVNSTGNVVANTLADLTRRECRFAHTGTYPFDVRNWQWTVKNLAGGAAPGVLTFATLPTLNECTSTWSTEQAPPTAAAAPSIPYLDFWTNNPTYRLPETALSGGGGAAGTRTTDDIILTNVIGFDVKAWDPNYVDPATGVMGAYVDLGYNNVGGAGSASQVNSLQHLGAPKSPAFGGTPAVASRFYDTFSTHYEVAGAPGLAGTVGQSVNGMDNNGNGVVNDLSFGPTGENLTNPPYPMPLRGIQVKIRTFEPDSKQIREVTVEQPFLPQ
jgi:hypothetical protein